MSAVATAQRWSVLEDGSCFFCEHTDKAVDSHVETASGIRVVVCQRCITAAASVLRIESGVVDAIRAASEAELGELQEQLATRDAAIDVLEATVKRQAEDVERLRAEAVQRRELLLRIVADANQLVVTG